MDERSLLNKMAIVLGGTGVVVEIDELKYRSLIMSVSFHRGRPPT